jgi:hypothetical protein
MRRVRTCVHVNPRIKEGERISGGGGGRRKKGRWREGGGEGGGEERKNVEKIIEGENDYVREESDRKKGQ